MSIRFGDDPSLPPIDVIALSGTNIGRSRIRVVDLPFLRFDSGLQCEMFPNEDRVLPMSLDEGETVKLTWDLSLIERFLKTPAVNAVLACGFVDALGDQYVAAYPGVVVKRKGWRRRREYVLVSQPASPPASP
jgi:hypothetical protein